MTFARAAGSGGRAPSVMCHMTFADESAIITHYDTAHAPSRGRPRKSRVTCEVCGIKFADSSNKRRHIRSASATCDVNMFQCDCRNVEIMTYSCIVLVCTPWPLSVFICVFEV